MRDWKTTLMGAALAAYTVAVPLWEGTHFALDKATLLVVAKAALFAGLGYFAKDGTPSTSN